MEIEEIRIYSEVLEQGLDFKDYFLKAGIAVPIKTIYTKKGRASIEEDDSFLTRLRNCKDVDVLISFVTNNKEYPVLMVEYSTAVPTDDHKMQRSDVYFWGSLFSVPELKIYPESKGMNQEFGGGDRFTDEQEQMIAYRRGCILWPVLWQTVDSYDVLWTKDNSLSCIHYSSEIYEYIRFIIDCYKRSDNYLDLHNREMLAFKRMNPDLFRKYESNNLHTMIVDSSRFKWDRENKRLIVKINRFGHAMDPDRGVLFFANMLVGYDHLTTEIQVNRSPDIYARGGYSSLFDSTSQATALLAYVQTIISTKGNRFDDEDAIYVFRQALNIPDDFVPFKKIKDHEYEIDDWDMMQFMMQYPSITTKSIFLLSSELRLTDANRKTICSVRWKQHGSKVFLDSLLTDNFTPLALKPLGRSDIREDIVTYASVELYKRLQFGLLAVSYPGAQGDRCILTGSGRNVKRTYVDIIAYSLQGDEYIVYLEECKDSLSKSEPDMKKLVSIVDDEDKIEGLKNLFRKTLKVDDFTKVYKSIGGALTERKINTREIDYIFMFDIKDCGAKNSIFYTIALVDLSLVDTFRPLADKNNKLQGEIELNDVYIIV